MVYGIIISILIILGFIGVGFYYFKIRKHNINVDTEVENYINAIIETRSYYRFTKEEIEERENELTIKKDEVLKSRKSFILPIIATIILLVSGLTLPFSFKSVDTGEVAVVKRLGKIVGVDNAGVYFHLWLTDSYTRVDTKLRSIQMTTQTYSNDKQPMEVLMNVQYQVVESEASNIVKTYGNLGSLESKIVSVIIERTKTVLSEQTATEIITKRDSISKKVTMIIDEALKSYGVAVRIVSLENIDFSDAFENAVEQSMIAEQEKVKAQAEAEKKLIEAKNKVALAEQQALEEAKKAQGLAEAEKIKAEGQAKALQVIQEAWNGIKPEVQQTILHNLALEKWDGKLPETVVGSDFIEKLLGAIGGIKTPIA